MFIFGGYTGDIFSNSNLVSASVSALFDSCPLTRPFLDKQERPLRIQVSKRPVVRMEVRRLQVSRSAISSRLCGVQRPPLDLRRLRWQRPSQRHVEDSTERRTQGMGRGQAARPGGATDMLQFPSRRCQRLHVRLLRTVRPSNHQQLVRVQL